MSVPVLEAQPQARPETTSELPLVRGSLSPSRAADFKTCPLLYRLRSLDRLPQRPTPAATRGTMVHAVLDQLYDLPAALRTPDRARALVSPEWSRMCAEDLSLPDLFAAAPGWTPQDWLESARELVGNYFRLEDPTRLEPAGREERVEVVVDGLRLRGYVDRIDVNPAGDVRVVDYKTGATPREAFESKALFQMKFYALVLWRTRGVVPKQLRLIYLADCETLTYAPDVDELGRFERTLHAIWSAVDRCTQDQDFQPSPGPLCRWCDYHAHCPAQGGELPPFPDLHAAAGPDGRDRRAAESALGQSAPVA